MQTKLLMRLILLACCPIALFGSTGNPLSPGNPVLTYSVSSATIPSSSSCTYYRDADGDGYGNSNSTITNDCSGVPSGYVLTDGDCNDTNADIHPGAVEICNGLDDNCNCQTDEELGLNYYYADADGDGYGNASVYAATCGDAPTGFVTDDTDCDDTNAAINPDATEICDYLDNDCDGLVDEGVLTIYYADNDGDGYGFNDFEVPSCEQPEGPYVTIGGDCDDTNPNVNPGAVEICNEIDDDCDGVTDEGVQSTFYADEDGDGYGDAEFTTIACTAPDGYVNNSDDCDDGNADVHPGATEVCNGIDDDCDGVTDEGVQSTFYVDEDGDGYGDAEFTTIACTAPDGYVSNSDDCDDGNADVHPGATEVCNGIDDDCDGAIDEEVQSTFYADTDGDGYGDAEVSTLACTAPEGYVSNDEDCDDGNAEVNPAATEICNGIDDDCDGFTDDNDPSIVGQTTYYADSDNDGYGDGEVSIQSCDVPEGYVTDDTDCDDGDSNVHPGATEVCNGIDDDCDGAIDEEVQSTFYADTDEDGYGDESNSIDACTAPEGYVSDNTDCDDGNVAINPGATEICGDAIDNNCDGVVDEGCFITYCASSGSGAPGNKFIKQIKMLKVSNSVTVLNNISNNNNGYGNYTGINTNVDANAAYKLTLYPSIIVGVPVSFAWKVWIDYNRDGDFNDAGENVATASANGNVSPANIVIPNGAVQEQDLRMRVSMKLGTVPITYNGPCDNGFNGEVEDYTITVHGGILRLKSATNGLTRSVDNQLQIAESNDLDFEIFPNPTKGKVYINCTGNFDGMATAYIHDLQGRRIHQQLVNMSLGHKLEIDAPSLQSGTYAVTIVNADDQIQTQLLEVRN